MTVEVRLAGALRPYADAREVTSVDLPDEPVPTVGLVLDGLERKHPGLAGRLRDERGRIRRHVNVFVGAEHVRELGGLLAPVDGRAPVWILPAISGGAPAG